MSIGKVNHCIVSIALVNRFTVVSIAPVDRFTVVSIALVNCSIVVTNALINHYTVVSTAFVKRTHFLSFPFVYYLVKYRLCEEEENIRPVFYSLTTLVIWRYPCVENICKHFPSSSIAMFLVYEKYHRQHKFLCLLLICYHI